MKYVILVGDGMGDYPLPELDGRTVLEASRTPNMDRLARGGLLGLAQTIPAAKEPGSDVANMAILGYDPMLYHTGRGPLEAGSMGVKVAPDELAFRMNLVTLVFEEDGRIVMGDHSSGHITSEEAAELIKALDEKMPLTGGQKLFPGVSYRHLLLWSGLPDGLPTVPPHDYRDQDVAWYLNSSNPELKPVLDLIRASWEILGEHPVNKARVAQGKRPANSIWPWGQGRPPAMATFQERWGLTGAVVSAVDLIKGLGVYAGLEALDIPGATGFLDTNFAGKVEAALKALETGDFVLVHVEAPDEAAHQGETDTKIKAIEAFDEKVVGPMMEGLEKMGDFRVAVLCDHFTPVSVKTHTREPVPFLIYPASEPSGRNFSEAEASSAGLYLEQGCIFIDLLLGAAK